MYQFTLDFSSSSNTAFFGLGGGGGSKLYKMKEEKACMTFLFY